LGDAQYATVANSAMSYVIHYVNVSQQGGVHRVLPMKFQDKEAALDSACALKRAGFRVSKVEGPHFELGSAEFESYFHGERLKRRA
jgi:hypothetical protein